MGKLTRSRRESADIHSHADMLVSTEVAELWDWFAGWTSEPPALFLARQVSSNARSILWALFPSTQCICSAYGIVTLML